MVHFEKNKLIIEIECHNSVETWIELHDAICDMLYFVNADTINDQTFYNIPMFLRELIPSWDKVKHLKPK